MPTPAASETVPLILVGRVELSSGSESLGGFAIDCPEPGQAFDGYCLPVVGWVAGRLARATAIKLVHGDQVLRTVPVSIHRKGVAAQLQGSPNATASGFSTSIGLLGIPEDFAIHIRAILADGQVVELGCVVGRRRRLQTPYAPRLRPIMVTSLGRTGTTWLMRLIAEHPLVVALRRYPYEMRTARYWAHMLRVLAEPANHAESAHPDSFHADAKRIGHNPFFSQSIIEVRPVGAWFVRDYVERLAAFCQENADECYERIASVQRQEGATYFAEKHLPDELPRVLWEMYPDAREVFLVRDPRDMFISMIAFNEKRGFRAFGRERVQSDAEFMRQLRGDLTRLLESWRSRERQAHLVRYEDLVNNPTETLRTALDYLAVPSDATAIDGMLERASVPTDELVQHRTSPDPGASVGRWRDAAHVNALRTWDEVFGEFLEAFGYV